MEGSMSAHKAEIALQARAGLMKEGGFSSWWKRMLDSDVVHGFRASRTAPPAALFLTIVLIYVVGAHWIAPYDPYDLASVDLLDAQLPPAWVVNGSWAHPLGTDEQGRDLLSAMIYGARTSLSIGAASVLLAGAIGITLGLLAGYLGSFIDAISMRAADIQMTIPDVMLALLVTGVLHAVLPRDFQARAAPLILVLAIGISNWPQYARVVRACTLAERGKDYVLAARITGVHPWRILSGHILLNIAGPICILGTQGIASAILAESALSFIGVGMPITEPSLGTLIRIGNAYLYSGEWWTTAFPAVGLSAVVLSINILGDWLKDALNPKLG
jgi:peptide/nickel transport system permease protein